MQKKRLFALLALFPLCSLASQTYLCDPPQGSRVDYFSYNTINLQNNTFLMSRDKASSVRPKIVFNDNGKEVLFSMEKVTPDNTPAMAATMIILQANENQISFAGILNNAPILATFYPIMNVLIYSQQSIWPGPDYNGARAIIFYSTCVKS